MNTHPNTHAEAAALLTIIEAAQRLRSSRSTVYELMATRELRSLHVNRRRFIPASEVDRFIAARLAAESELSA